MSPDLTKSLYKKFPKIFPEKLPYGFEFSDGWYDLVFDLLSKLQKQINASKCEQIIGIQCKQKFGELRFYYTGGNEKCGQIIEDYRKLSLETCEETGGPGFLHHKDNWLKTLCPQSAILLGYQKYD